MGLVKKNYHAGATSNNVSFTRPSMKTSSVAIHCYITQNTQNCAKLKCLKCLS